MKKVLIFLLTLLLTTNITIAKAEEIEYNGENLLPGVVEKSNELLLKIIKTIITDEDAIKESETRVQNNTLEKMISDGYTIYYRIKQISDDQIEKAVELSETEGKEEEKLQTYNEIMDDITEDIVKSEFTKTDTTSITLPELTKEKGYHVAIYAIKVESGMTATLKLQELFQATSDKTLKHVDIFKNTDFSKLAEEELNDIENNALTNKTTQKTKTTTETNTNQTTQENQQVANEQTLTNPNTGLKEYLIYLTLVILSAGIFLATKKTKVFKK